MLKWIYSVPDRNTLLLMTQREHELQQSNLVLKAYSTPYLDKRAITLQLQLRIVREFGLPDSTVEVLQNGQFYYPEDLQFVQLERHYPRTATPRNHRRLASPVKHSSSTPISPTHSYSPVEVSFKSPSAVIYQCEIHRAYIYTDKLSHRCFSN